jgi:hypothetical protein
MDHVNGACRFDQLRITSFHDGLHELELSSDRVCARRDGFSDISKMHVHCVDMAVAQDHSRAPTLGTEDNGLVVR